LRTRRFLFIERQGVGVVLRKILSKMDSFRDSIAVSLSMEPAANTTIVYTRTQKSTVTSSVARVIPMLILFIVPNTQGPPHCTVCLDALGKCTVCITAVYIDLFQVSLARNASNAPTLLVLLSKKSPSVLSFR
jgi:hypothetical protein